MYSKGGKILYMCPNCRSVNIHKTKMYGQQSYDCNACNTWGPWKDRIKLSIKKELARLKEIQGDKNDYFYTWHKTD